MQKVPTHGREGIAKELHRVPNCPRPVAQSSSHRRCEPKAGSFKRFTATVGRHLMHLFSLQSSVGQAETFQRATDHGFQKPKKQNEDSIDRTPIRSPNYIAKNAVNAT